MFAYPLRAAALVAVAAIGLSGCAYNGLYSGVGVGVGSGYGYGYGYGYDPYYGYGHSRYGYDPYWGWYDGFYYPGTGYYVYDRHRRPYPWRDSDRDYWERRRERAMSSGEFRRQMEAQRIEQDQQNWSAFEQAPSRVQRIRQSDGRSTRLERSNSTRVERSKRSTRSDRASSRSSRSSTTRQSASDFRRSQESDRND